MITPHTPESLSAFENLIADAYNAGKIHAPIHLRGGNEQQLINIFNKLNIQEHDWIVTTWCSHLECLLKGVKESELYDAILAKKSITLCFKKEKVISSAIVGATPSIANGLGMAAKLKDSNERVFCFIGDMGAMTGQAHENILYASLNHLPVHFIIADNGLSVKTPTNQVWNTQHDQIEEITKSLGNVHFYTYKNTWPHSGTGKFVNLW